MVIILQVHVLLQHCKNVEQNEPQYLRLHVMAKIPNQHSAQSYY